MGVAVGSGVAVAVGVAVGSGVAVAVGSGVGVGGAAWVAVGAAVGRCGRLTALTAAARNDNCHCQRCHQYRECSLHAALLCQIVPGARSRA